jgi:hypothetical protein
MTTTIVQNSFLPTQISGCQLWFDAADRTTFTLNGSAVSSWRDKSANGYSVGQATGGNQPTYATNLLNGLPGIQLSISTYLYQLGSNMPNFASANAITVFIVAKNGTSLGGGWNIVNTMYFTGGAGATLRYHFSFGQNGTNGVTLYANNSFIGQTTVVPLNTNAIIGFTVASTGTNIDVNSTLTNYTGASLISANDSTWFIFGDARGTFVSDVNVYEFVGYSTTLTTAQRQQVEGYLAQKWGLQSSLPSNHPYRYSAYFTNQAYISTMVSQNLTNRLNNAAFLPTSIPGCQLWLDAADISTLYQNTAGTTPVTAAGQQIQYWKDKSGNARNATSSDTAMSYNTSGIRYPSIYFTGGQATGFQVNVAVRDSTYFFVVNNAAAPLNDVRVYNSHNGTIHLKQNWWFNTYRTQVDYAGIAGPQGPDNTSGVTLVMTRQDTSSTGLLSAWQTGTSIGSTTASAVIGETFTSFVLGTDNGGSSFPMIGYMGEVIVYNSVLSTAQRQQVEGYLAWKWGLQVNLPPTHPYKNTSAVFATQPSILAALNANPYNNMILFKYFNPTSISGTQLWFDAADRTSMTFSGSTVTQWNDKSGNGRNATNGSYVAPTYSATAFNGGYPGLLFNGSSTMLNTAALLPTPVLSANGTDTSIFVVFNYNFIGANYGVYGLGSQFNTYVLRTPWNIGSFGTAIIDTTSSSSRILFTFPSTQAAPQLYSIFRSGASHYFYQFGSLTASNLSSSGTVGTTSQTFGIGGGIADGIYFNSYISEIVIYNVALTTAQRQQVEGYLAWKWGLQANLPATHPFKGYPPPP